MLVGVVGWFGGVPGKSGKNQATRLLIPRAAFGYTGFMVKNSKSPHLMLDKHPMSDGYPAPEKVQLSPNQRLVWKQLEATKAPLSAYQILKKVSGKGISAPQQIYRALTRLIDVGLVHRLESVNGYVACTQKTPHPYQDPLFAICENCGQTFEIKAKKALKLLHEKAFKIGFATGRTHIELRGQCASCLDGDTR